MICEETHRAALEQMGSTSSRASPCCFVHRDRGLHLVVHGDDLTALGIHPDLDVYEKELAKSSELKIKGRIGEKTELKTMRILNRIVTLTPEGLIYESDPRHAELMVRNLGIGGSKGAGPPGAKLPDISDEAPKDNGTDPWDDEPWRDSKPDGYSEVGTVGDGDADDKKSCGNLLDSHEKRELEQLKACVLQSLYGYSEWTGEYPERFLPTANNTAKLTQESCTCTGISPELLAYIGGSYGDR